MAHAQHLDVNAAQVPDDLVVPAAGLPRVRGQAVRHVGVGGVDIDVVEEVGLHEIAVALVMGGGQADILVQVYRAHPGEAQISLLVPLHQLTVGPDGRGARGQPQHAVRIQDHVDARPLEGRLDGLGVSSQGTVIVQEAPRFVNTPGRGRSCNRLRTLLQIRETLPLACSEGGHIVSTPENR